MSVVLDVYGEPRGNANTGNHTVAARRLAFGRAGLSVEAVSAKVGFGSAAAFSRAHHRKFSAAPIYSKTKPWNGA